MKKINFLAFLGLVLFSCEQPTNTPTTNWVVPTQYLATLSFDGIDYFDNGETNFPITFNFNQTQDANMDGVFDVEDNLENLVRYSIGNNVIGAGRTGLANRGMNNQRPSVYFHFVETSTHFVYQYWLYYADNNWANDHEHDWEKYFVYVNVATNLPEYIKVSHHDDFNTYNWSQLSLDNGHPILSADGGSHAMKIGAEDGVTIRYNGEITKNNGTLINGDQQTIPWEVYSEDPNTLGIINYTALPDTFFYGDSFYITNNNELNDARLAPWMRNEWGNPPVP